MAAFTNQAMLSYNGLTAVSNTVTGEILGAVSISKTAVSDSYSAGESLTYIISIINQGETALDPLTLTDDLGAFEAEAGKLTPLTYVSGSAELFINGVRQEEPVPQEESPLTFTGISIPAGGSAVLAYSALVNRFAPLAAGSSITNTVTAGSASASAAVRASEAPALSISKAISPASVTENGEVCYTFVIENTGCAEAGEDDELIFSDLFSPALTGLEASLDGTALSAGTDYTYEEGTGEFKTVPGALTVPAAEFILNPDGSVGVEPGRVTLTITGALQ